MAPRPVRNLDTVSEYKSDQWGYDVRSSSDDCITFLNKYYVEVLSYGRDKRLILQAADADRGCALACGLAAAYLWAPQKSKTLAPNTLVYLAAAKANLDRASNYETLVVRALITWVEHGCEDALAQHFEASPTLTQCEMYCDHLSILKKTWHDEWIQFAVGLSSQILDKYPKDLLTLKRAQTMCFTMGRSEDMLNLALKVLPSNVGSPYMFGMLAFALVEVGSIRKAESAARLALTLEDRDVWAQHALCHVLEYQCRFEEALTFMRGCRSSWLTCCSFMRDHNWWHVATCQLELGGARVLNKVLDLYDKHIWGTHHGKKNPQKYINAFGLLLRLETRVHRSIIDDRILQVVSSLNESAFKHQELLLDVLSIWAFGRAHQHEEAFKMLNNVKCRVLAMEGHKQENLAAGLCEYGRGNFIAVADSLGSSFTISKLKALGASTEQLDVFEDIWCIAYLRAGRAEKVVEMAERLTGERPGISFRWRILEEAYAKTGQTTQALVAGSEALALESAAEREWDLDV